MKMRILLAFAPLAVLMPASCEKMDNQDNGGSLAIEEVEVVEETPIAFALEDTLATKAPSVVTSLDSFKVTATTGSAGSETAVSNFTNVTFSKSGTTYVGGKVWPNSNPGYHFYASNVQMTNNQAGQLVNVSTIDTDVVCAYLASPTFKQTNTLTFEHILARVGTVTVSLNSGFTNVAVKMKYSGSGTYNMRTKAWSGVGSQQDKTLSVGNNNFWIIPGTYTLTLTFKDVAGNNKTKTLSKEFKAGMVNNITVQLGQSSDVVVSQTTEYEAPTFTLGSISDIPASGGNSGAPSVTNIAQRKRTVYTYADGHKDYSAWTAVSNLSSSVTYCKTEGGSYVSTCPAYSAGNLTTTPKARTLQGSIYVKVTANSKSTVQSTTVYQQANVQTHTSTSCSVTGSDNMPDNPHQQDWVRASGGHFTLKAYAYYSYTSGSTNSADVSSSATYQIGSYNNCGATLSGATVTVPSRGTTTGDARYSVFRATYGGKQSGDAACGQEANTIVSTTQATDVTNSVSISLNPNTVLAAGGTVSVSGSRTFTKTAAKYTYTSGATSGGAVTTGNESVSVSVSASSTTGLTISGQSITVGAYSGTSSDRTWTIYGTYNTVKSNGVTLTQKKKSSWDVGDDDEEGGSGEGGEF